MKRFLAIFVLLLPATASAETILTAEVDRDTITVGDPVVLTVGVAAPVGDESAVPVFPEGKVGPFEILEKLPVRAETRDGVHTEIARFRITAFETGDFEIPAITPPGGGKGTDPILISVISVGVDPNGDLRDVKPPVAIGLDIARLLLLAGAALVLLAIATFLWIRRRRRIVLPDPVLAAADLRPAHVIAYERLEALHGELSNGGADRAYWFRLSDVVRDYLDRRYAVPAPERTSRETLRLLKREELSPEAVALLRDFFARSDLAKYRGAPPEDGDATSAAVAARRFVDLTRERGAETEGTER